MSFVSNLLFSLTHPYPSVSRELDDACVVIFDLPSVERSDPDHHVDVVPVELVLEGGPQGPVDGLGADGIGAAGTVKERGNGPRQQRICLHRGQKRCPSVYNVVVSVVYSESP